MKKIMCLFSFFIFVNNVLAEDISKYAESAILIEASTKEALYEKDADIERAPASMTKIMSMILITDEIKKGNISLDEKVEISENASNMGGSQVYLNIGERYKVEDLLKSIAIASANDAVVALAERVGGTEEHFVELMNEKCKKIGCKHTNFMNPHGLDQEGHYSSARDMALMASYLIKNYPDILKYTSIYEEYLKRPDGSSTWLVNTNKLVRFYDDVDGLKTGFTGTAGYCLTATAEKNNMRLISVVMGVDTSDNRTSDTVKMLNYGFNTYKMNVIYEKNKVIGEVKVEKGKEDKVNLVLLDNAKELTNNSEDKKKYTIKIEKETLIAPIKKGKVVGIAEIYDNEGMLIDEVDITVEKDIYKANLWDYIKKNFNIAISGKNMLK